MAPYRCSRKRSEVKSRYSETLWPVMSVRMSPVTTLIWGGCPPTLLGHENPVPCAEQVQRTGSCTRRGREGADVHVSGPAVGGRDMFQACSESSSGDTGESEGAGEGGGGTKLDSGSPCVKDSRHILSKNRAASRRDSPLLKFSMGPREPLAGDLSTQVAPTPEGSRNVLTSCWGLASGDSRNRYSWRSSLA